MTISSSLTPADLSGFDIIISWTVSDDSIVDCYIIMYSHCLVFVIILYPVTNYVDIRGVAMCIRKLNVQKILNPSCGICLECMFLGVQVLAVRAFNSQVECIVLCCMDGSKGQSVLYSYEVEFVTVSVL